MKRMIPKAILPLTGFLLCLMAYPQESNVRWNTPGKDFNSLKHTWKAKWIPHPYEPTNDYGVFLFRREFEMETLPDEYIIYVSADNRMKLTGGKQNMILN
jgi:hypothetical protein